MSILASGSSHTILRSTLDACTTEITDSTEENTDGYVMAENAEAEIYNLVI
jgi:hypothetical protein